MACHMRREVNSRKKRAMYVNAKKTNEEKKPYARYIVTHYSFGIELLDFPLFHFCFIFAPKLQYFLSSKYI